METKEIVTKNEKPDSVELKQNAKGIWTTTVKVYGNASDPTLLGVAKVTAKNAQKVCDELNAPKAAEA